MKIPSRLFIVSLLLFATRVLSQPPAPPNPQAPVITSLSQVGFQRGQHVEIILTGNNFLDPTGIQLSFLAKVSIPSDSGNGKNPNSLRVKIEVPKNAPVGINSLRLMTLNGASNFKAIFVDDMPVIIPKTEKKSGNAPEPTALNNTVQGKTSPESADFFKVSARAGQKICFEVIARRLGSLLDPQITILDSKTHRELPGGYSNDSPGLQTDCRLSYTFKESGDFLISIRDVNYRGGNDYFYLLRLGDFPGARSTYPLAIKRGIKRKISFSGMDLEGVLPVEIEGSKNPLEQVVMVTPAKSNGGTHGLPVPLILSDLDELEEKEPNDEAKKANRIPVPSGISGKLEVKNDQDYYVFLAKKGQRIVIESHTSENQLATEVSLTLTDSKGTQIATSNPSSKPKMDFTASADGDYYLLVEHLHGWGGEAEAYRLTLTPYRPDFTVSLNMDRWDASSSGKFFIPIFLAQDGYSGAVDLSVRNRTGGLSGSLKIPPGTAKGPSAPTASLEIKVGDIPPGPLEFQLQAESQINNTQVIKPVNIRNLLIPGLNNLPFPPRNLETNLTVAITEKNPFGASLEFDKNLVELGKSLKGRINVIKPVDFTGELTFKLQGLPAGVKTNPDNLKLLGNQKIISFEIITTSSTPPGINMLIASGEVNYKNRKWIISSSSSSLQIKK